MENERTPGQREMKIMEQFVKVCEEYTVLGIAVHALTGLAYLLDTERKALEECREVGEQDERIRKGIAKAAILLDSLQLIFGDVAEHELEYLQKLEEIFGEDDAYGGQ